VTAFCVFYRLDLVQKSSVQESLWRGDGENPIEIDYRPCTHTHHIRLNALCEYLQLYLLIYITCYIYLVVFTQIIIHTTLSKNTTIFFFPERGLTIYMLELLALVYIKECM
jgi:hypothetical protein